MTKILIEDREFINELEALQVDTQSLQALITYMTNSDCNMSSDNFLKIYSEYKNTYRNYENKKLELEKRYIYPVVSHPIDWNLEFASGELTVNDD